MTMDSTGAVLFVTYRFASFNEQALDQPLRALETVAPGNRRPWGLRAGAIDLVSFLEIVLGLPATLALKKYLEGLLDVDTLKALGVQHRRAIDDWVNHFRVQLTSLAMRVNELVAGGLPALLEGKEQALALVIIVDSAECYVVLNHRHMSEALTRDLPRALEQLLRIVAQQVLPQDAPILQLYFDRSATRWKYLFAPTVRGFGNHIDRYIDIDSGSVHQVDSNHEFRRLFNPVRDDEFKFLVSPFRDESQREG